MREFPPKRATVPDRRKRWLDQHTWTPIGPAEDLDLESVIGQAVGSASVCWGRPGPAQSVFDSERAQEIVTGLRNWIEREWAKRLLDETGAQLGLATTRELLAEITARIDVDGSNGGGGLDYRTVGDG